MLGAVGVTDNISSGKYTLPLAPTVDPPLPANGESYTPRWDVQSPYENAYNMAYLKHSQEIILAFERDSISDSSAVSRHSFRVAMDIILRAFLQRIFTNLDSDKDRQVPIRRFFGTLCKRYKCEHDANEKAKHDAHQKVTTHKSRAKRASRPLYCILRLHLTSRPADCE
jgi:hypothetical protein